MPSAGPHTRLEKRLLFLISVSVGALAVALVLFMPAPPVPSDVPLPFPVLRSLQGAVTEIGVIGGRRVVTVTFAAGEIKEPLTVNDLSIVLTPSDDGISHGAPLSVALTPGKRLFGYKYTSLAAIEEKDAQARADGGEPMSFRQMFPGEFIVSGEQRADGNFIAAFEAQKNITFLPLDQVTLDRSARYVFVTNDAATELTVRGLHWCGDGAVGGSEQCDDGNRASADGCSLACTVEQGFTCSGQPSVCEPIAPGCGNGVVDTGEQCDGPSASGCSATCRLGLGDLIIDDGDSGFATTGSWTQSTTGFGGDRRAVPALNSSTCTWPTGCRMLQNAGASWTFANLPAGTYDVYGYWREKESLRPSHYHRVFDGAAVVGGTLFPEPWLEKDGTAQWGKIGSFPVQSGTLKVETTNDVGLSSNYQYPATVYADAVMIRRSVCGDGVSEGGEACDDGNGTDGDGCTVQCIREFCGDRTVQPGLGEQCDDGNTLTRDGCDATCKTEPVVCGDSIIQSFQQEQCDDGNTASGDGCSASCRSESMDHCGDGIRNHPQEECDDGDRTSGDGCDMWCRTENTCTMTVPNINDGIRFLKARDTDRDGMPNAVVATNTQLNMIYSFSPGQNGQLGTFATARNGLPPMYTILLPEAEFGDLDADGIDDMVVSGYAYRGKTDQTFEAGIPLLSTQYPQDYPAVSVTDLDGDNDRDIVLRHYEGSNYSSYLALLNEGSWQFRQVQIAGSGNGDMAVGFVDHDRLPDFVIGSELSGQISIILNHLTTDPSNPFERLPGISAPHSGVDLGDFNRDGHTDILLSKREETNLLIYYGNGGGSYTFFPVTTIPMYIGDKEPAILDLDGDGDSDIVLRGSNGKSVQTLIKVQGLWSMNEGVRVCP